MKCHKQALKLLICFCKALSKLVQTNALHVNSVCTVHQAYHVSVPWGSLSDCNSWQPPPRWVWSALQPKARAQDLCSSASCVSTDIDSQQTVPSASTDDAQDEPCVIASFSLDSEREPCPPSKVADLCQPSVALQEDLDQATKTQPAPAQAATVEDNTAVSKLKATPHRLHISCAPLVHHISLPPMLTASRRVAFADGLLHSNAAAPVLY